MSHDRSGGAGSTIEEAARTAGRDRNSRKAGKAVNKKRCSGLSTRFWLIASSTWLTAPKYKSPEIEPDPPA